MNLTPAPRKKTILVAEDDAAIARLLERALGVRYDVVVASDGPGALSQAADLTPDLLMLDIAMPGLDGFGVAERLRSLPSFKNVPVIFITAQANATANLRALEMGASDFITKPFRLSHVLDKVKEVLNA
jgi:DNA-binding response OmpR family regulator